MKKRFVSLFLMTSGFCACTNSTDKVAENRLPDKVVHTDSPKQLCFQSIRGKDTVLLEMEISDHKTASGRLMYHFFEKDKNEGRFTGTIEGDTLLAYYTFTSEGQASVRQVIFLRKDNSWVEGYGAASEGKDTARFTDISAVTFTGVPLYPCDPE